uniref:RPA1 related single stranded DNA binding protein, X-linked n=1 Tax=Malurus cyaneus samueli TaxID=2593467 RepID=A0A8C5U9Z6_9PASS
MTAGTRRRGRRRRPPRQRPGSAPGRGCRPRGAPGRCHAGSYRGKRRGEPGGGHGGGRGPLSAEGIRGGAGSSQLSAVPGAAAVTVVAVERYLAQAPPAARSHYWYDLTLADSARRHRCHLEPRFNALVQRARLRPGTRVRLTRCSYRYDEKRLNHGFLCLEGLERAGDGDTAVADTPPDGLCPLQPLRGDRRHYLPLWNNEDPYGDVWVRDKPPVQVDVDVSKLTNLGHLEMTWRSRVHFPPLLVRILHKSRLRYYGKPEKKMDMAYFEVADGSGMMSMVLWNSLCPEWYHTMKVGSVLLLEKYAIKTSFPFKTHPTPGDSQMKKFATIEISLNGRDPPTEISIIPEDMVKPEWGLPEVKYRFITRSELEDLPNNHTCDVIGLVTFVGRAERARKREQGEDFWLYRWAHAIDGTSDQPFILELFATSQPDVFERIHPMTYLVCTQMRVIRNLTENPSRTIYLTTSNESQIFITGWHKGQPYAKDDKVKNFIQWTKSQSESDQIKKTIIGGYYPFPRPPESFLKYSESVLKPIGEIGKEIEDLHYREHKQIAVQGIISAIRYKSWSNAAEEAPGGELLQVQCVRVNAIALKQCVQDSGWEEQIWQGTHTRKAGMGQIGWGYQEGVSDTPETEETGRTCDSWQSDLWAQVKDKLINYLHHSKIFPESIPCKFDYVHKDFLLQQYNLLAAVHQPIEARTAKNISEFKRAHGLGYYEVTVLGVNHDIAIDVAFLPLFCPDNPHLFQLEDIQNDTLLSCMSCISACQQKATSSEKLHDTFPLSDEIVKAAKDLDGKHVVCILDICHLGDDKVEVFLSKIYKTMEPGVLDPV